MFNQCKAKGERPKEVAMMVDFKYLGYWTRASLSYVHNVKMKIKAGIIL